MLSSFFLRTNKATAITVIFWVLNFVPYLQVAIATTYQKAPAFHKNILSLAHNAAMSIGMKIILAHEVFGGLRWENMKEYLNDNVNLRDMMVMLLIDSGIYIAVTFVVNFYHLRFNKLEVNKLKEFEATNCSKTIEVRGLCKKYSRDNAALENVSMDFHEDQIAAIIG